MGGGVVNEVKPAFEYASPRGCFFNVVSLIGVQRALKCNCLPGYKLRWQQWQELISWPKQHSVQRGSVLDPTDSSIMAACG